MHAEPGGGGWSCGGDSNIKVVYMCRTGFKNGGLLRERPPTENGGGGFQSCPHRQKGVVELKITKKGLNKC